MRLSDLIDAMEQIAPTRHAESWDNVGLLAGDPRQGVSKAILTIDYTPAVAEEAKAAGCDAVIAYHPPIFDAIKRITSVGPSELVFDAIRRGVAIYSPHTALDVAEGGTNDVLADAIALVDRQPLRLAQPKANQYKLVTFVPKDAVEKVSRALFDAGAGRIGNYTQCSFRTSGTGTFFGETGASPTLGQAGKLEEPDEVRVETVVPIAKIGAVLSALRQSHPYEEPAFDLNQLAAAPESNLGLGRVGKLPGEVTAEMLINMLKRELGLEHVLAAGDPARMVRRAAVCAGACGDLLDDAIAQQVDLYVTGEIRHHDALKAIRAGMTVVCTLHSNSERAVLKRVKSRLEGQLPGFAVMISKTDADPFEVR
ncbi:MAG: Nif3-like dinuclear metal center hexameric protein [Tepidisphaeraceae bacterium]